MLNYHVTYFLTPTHLRDTISNVYRKGVNIDFERKTSETSGRQWIGGTKNESLRTKTKFTPSTETHQTAWYRID